MAKTLVPSEFKTHLIDQILESITEQANTTYYAFIGNHISEGSTEEEVDQPFQNYKTVQIDTYRNMIIGKRMTASDMTLMVPRYDWENGTVYTMYDDQQTDILNTNFFVVVDETAYKHVYKCLYNNNGAPSTVKPLFKDAKYDADLFEPGDDYYETNDGYQWKYMYSIDSRTFSRFATQKYIPVVANTIVQENASAGSIDCIRVISGGKNYNNSRVGQFITEDINRITPTVAAQQIPAMSGPAFWYRIREASQVENFYKNTVLYLTSGTGAGQFRNVVESRYVVGLGVFVKVSEQFTVIPDDTTTYELTPRVRIVGNGSETVKATARAVIDSTSANSIQKIEMLDIGKGYTFASAEVLTGAPADVNLESAGELIIPVQAEIRPIISPLGGHGADAASELGANRISMKMKFNRDENNLVSAENTFGQFGILRDPKFANVEIYFTGPSGSFIEGEEVIQINTQKLDGLWHANTDISNGFAVERSDGLTDNYDDFFTVGDGIYVRDVQTQEVFLTEVATGSTNSIISLANTIPFLSAGVDNTVEVFRAKKIASAVISNINPPVATPGALAILVNECEPNFVLNKTIYGKESQVIATVSGIDINNRIGSSTASFGFTDYNQMMRIQGTTVDTFYNDEKVRQVSSVVGEVDATGFIHSWDANNLSLTRVEGDFETGSGLAIVGDSSSAIFQNVPGDTLDIKYGDLDPNFGSIIYIQNDIPVEREGNQSEEIRVILEF